MQPPCLGWGLEQAVRYYTVSAASSSAACAGWRHCTVSAASTTDAASLSLPCRLMA